MKFGQIVNMNKKYITPTTTVVQCHTANIMVGSYCEDERKRCNSNCKIWHVCQDRDSGTYCNDKRLY